MSNSHNNAINTDVQKRRSALLLHSGYGERSAVREFEMDEMERIPITLALSKAAFAQVCDEFARGRWISWPFPGYEIKLELDPAIEGHGVIHRHDGRRLEGQRMMAYTFPSTYLPDDITRLVRLSYAEAVRCYENACFLTIGAS